MATTKAALKQIADNAVMSARENAYATVAGSGLGDADPEFESIYRATLEGILDDSLRGWHCTNYGATKPLTDKQIAMVAKFAGVKGWK